MTDQGGVIERLSLIGVVPALRVEDARDAAPLCGALARGGLPAAEITCRSNAADEIFRQTREALPEALLGAGMVLGCAHADRAWAAGADYMVTPRLNLRMLDHCLDKGYPVLTGCSNRTDIETALERGIRTVRFFPAEALGGLERIGTLAASYSELRFIPAGGIGPGNLSAYLDHPRVVACAGSWMAPEDAVAAKDWARVERLAREAVRFALGFEIRHVGINCEDPARAREAAERLSLLTGWPVQPESDRAVYVGEQLEVMKLMNRGNRGHLALACGSVERAIWHLSRRGFRFDMATLMTGEEGKPAFVYLEDEIAGFSFHLIRK